MLAEAGPIGRFTTSKEVHIIGAGVSGLLMGHYLKEKGHKITIFEKSRIGGKISTVKTDLGPAETAANAIFTNPDVDELISKLGVKAVASRDKLKRKLWRDGRPRNFPLRPWELARTLLCLLRKPPMITERLSVYDFFAPLLGDKAAFEVLSAVFGGIYATNSKELNFKSVFKEAPQKRTYLGFFAALIKKRKASGHRARSVSFKNGMQDFINALSQDLQENIVREEKISIDPAVNTILCVDAIEAAQLLEDSYRSMASELKKLEYAQLSTGTYFFDSPAQVLEGTFGVLFPPGSGFESIGILNNTAIFPDRAIRPDLRSYTFISPKKDFNENAAASDIAKLEPAGGPTISNIQASKQTVWKRGIPLYNNARREALVKTRAASHSSPAGVVLFGNYVDGISIREMVTMAKNFAKNN